MTKAEFGIAIANLCALKRTADFTKPQVAAWFAVLGQFPAWCVNRAVVELATSQERFPEVGDLYKIARREAINHGLITEPYSPHGTGDGRHVGTKEVETIAAALNLAVKPAR